MHTFRLRIHWQIKILSLFVMYSATSWNGVPHSKFRHTLPYPSSSSLCLLQIRYHGAIDIQSFTKKHLSERQPKLRTGTKALAFIEQDEVSRHLRPLFFSFSILHCVGNRRQRSKAIGRCLEKERTELATVLRTPWASTSPSSDLELVPSSIGRPVRVFSRLVGRHASLALRLSLAATYTHRIRCEVRFGLF